MAAISIAAVLLVPLVVGQEILFPYVVAKAVVLRLALTVSLLVLLGALVTREYVLTDRSDHLMAAWALFILVSALTGVLGAAPMRSIFGELERMWGVIMWFYLLVWYALLRIVLRGREWRWVLAGSVAVACTVAIYTLLQRYGGAIGVAPPGATRSVPHGTLGNPSYLGIYTILSTAAALLLLVGAQSVRERGLWSAAVALLLLVFTLSGARTAFIGLVAGSVVGAGVLALSGGIPVRRLASTAGGRLAAAVAGVLALGLLALGGTGNPLVRRLVEVTWTSPTFTTRFAAWEAGWDQFLAAPLLGIGPENFGIAVSRHFPAAMQRTDSTTWDRAHNGYLEILVASGIVGLLAYLAVWVAFFWMVRRAYVAGRASPAVCAILSGTGLAYLVYLLMWFDDLASSLTLVLLLAYASHLRAGQPLVRFGAARAGAARNAVLVSLVAVVLLLFTYQRGYAVWRTAHETTAALRGRDVESRLEHYHAALDIGAVEGLMAAGLYTDFLRSFTPHVDQLRANPARAKIIWDALGRGLGEVQRASRLDPHNEVWWVDTSRLLLLAAELRRERRYYDASLEALQRAMELSPDRVSLRHLMAEVRLSAGDPEGAHAALDEAMRIDPSVPETYYYRARAYVVGGDLARSRAALTEALRRGYTERPAVLVWHLARLERDGMYAEALALLDAYREGMLRDSGMLPTLNGEAFGILSRRPIVALELGRAADAIRMAEELAAPYAPGRRTVRRFIGDVAAGWGDAWAAHPDLLSAGRAFGGLADPSRTRR